MEPKQSSDNRFALLIDADNVSSRYVKPILDELSKYGDVTIKRIYGDWTLNLHAKWKQVLLDNSITPIQQFGYTQGKNSTDSAMIIDAMDILYGDSVDGFCIVSSDSDFTRLASRLRESGRMVIGMGEKKTPLPFRRACDVFTALELLTNNGRQAKGGAGKATGEGGGTTPKADIEKAVVNIVTDNQNRGKATGLGEIGSRLLKRYPDFDVRSYGTNLLSRLLEEFDGVRIIKDHSSVTVELGDGADVAEGDETASEGHDGEGSGERSSSSRRRRGRRRRSGGQNGDGAAPTEAAIDEEAVEATAEEDSQVESMETAEEPAAEPAEAAEEAPKPRRKRGGRGRSKAKPAEAADETADAGVVVEEDAEEAELPSSEEAPEAAADLEAAEDAPKKRGRPRKKPTAAGTPQDHIRKLVRDAGADGIALSQLNNDVRRTFKDFKVRDLGFSQMRQYVASIDDFVVDKIGADYFVKLAE